jgi:hypothetical protein
LLRALAQAADIAGKIDAANPDLPLLERPAEDRGELLVEVEFVAAASADRTAVNQSVTDIDSHQWHGRQGCGDEQ